jgi:hypothetical protein
VVVQSFAREVYFRTLSVVVQLFRKTLVFFSPSARQKVVVHIQKRFRMRFHFWK